MAYHFYIGKMLCPIAPSKLQLKIANKNKTMTLINEGEVNVLKQVGLTDISFDLLLPNVVYPFAVYKSGFENAKYFLDELEKMKTDRKPFQFIVTRSFPNGKLLFDTNMKVSLESYEIKEESKQGFDVVVSIKLKQYRDFGTKICNVSNANNANNTKPTVSVETTRPAETSPKPQTDVKHLVKEGDTLWTLAKYYYNDESKASDIYEANHWEIDIYCERYDVPAKTLPIGRTLIIPAL